MFLFANLLQGESTPSTDYLKENLPPPLIFSPGENQPLSIFSPRDNLPLSLPPLGENLSLGWTLAPGYAEKCVGWDE